MTDVKVECLSSDNLSRQYYQKHIWNCQIFEVNSEYTIYIHGKHTLYQLNVFTLFAFWLDSSGFDRDLFKEISFSGNF